MYLSIFPQSGGNGAIMAEKNTVVGPSLQSKNTASSIQAISYHHHHLPTQKRKKRSGSSHVIHYPTEKLAATNKASFEGTIQISGSKRKLLVEKVKPPIVQKNNFVSIAAGSTSPR